MNILWLLYWIGVLIAVVLSFQAIKQKSFITGLVQLVLSIVVPLGQLMFSVVNNQSATGRNQFCFLMDYVVKFDFVAILIFFGYIAIIGLTFYHLENFCEKSKKLKKSKNGNSSRKTSKVTKTRKSKKK